MNDQCWDYPISRIPCRVSTRRRFSKTYFSRFLQLNSLTVCVGLFSHWCVPWLPHLIYSWIGPQCAHTGKLCICKYRIYIPMTRYPPTPRDNFTAVGGKYMHTCKSRCLNTNLVWWLSSSCEAWNVAGMANWKNRWRKIRKIVVAKYSCIFANWNEIIGKYKDSPNHWSLPGLFLIIVFW